MAGYNSSSSMGNDNGSLLHALFQSAPTRPDQQAPTGSQGAHNASPSFQAGPGYNQSLLHEFQSMNDPRSNYSSRVASPSSHQQPSMFRSNSGTPPGNMPPANVQRNEQKNNLLHLLQTQKPPKQDPRGDGTFNQGTYGNARAHLDQRSASMAGTDNHNANTSMSRSFSHQKTANHATPDSLLALLGMNQTKPVAPMARESHPPYENGTGAQQDNTSGKSPIASAKPVVSVAETTSLAELLSIKPKEPPKEDKSVEKLVEKSADELTDELANMLSINPVKESVDHGATESSEGAEHAAEINVEQEVDAANAKAINADETAAVDNPEIASVIDGVDNLSVDTSEPALGKRPEKAVFSDNARADSVADDWETAADNGVDADEGQDDTKTLVDVFNFHPLQPFMSITINSEFDMPRAQFSTDEDATMAIARLKKAFDQNDRTLVTATKNYIIFAMSKNGGVRVVRQDNGQNKMVFEETQDQIFNVAACVDKDSACETVVATGCSGTVYWFMARDARGETVEDITPHHSFALPPIQSPGDENPGGVLKTRARKSSNHTQFFGVGRGKSIHIIFPNLITKGDFYKPGTARTVDVEKYLAHRSLKIDTGKAAKDFTFSQDDTTVVSLDKAGRIKFWDIRGLFADDGKAQSVELTEPLLTLVTTPANEKSWPTSIIFIDKLRRVEKNNALRYLLVGMKQNHTLQLWDLALRRIVQEIHLPHDKDSDAACSVVYHVATSMIVVGHPTRNSVYFIHVSLPRFSNRKTLSQADFVEQIGKGTFETPANSAAFNTIREYTFSEGVKPATGSDKRVRGDLRSLDILQDPANTHDDSILFELYTMHSTGVTSIAIRPQTLGWNSKLADIKSLSAAEAGLTTSAKLRPFEQALLQKENLPSSPPVTASAPVQHTPQVKEILRKPASSSSPANVTTSQSPIPIKRGDSAQKVVTTSQDSLPAVEKSEKKKKRKGSGSSRASDISVDAAPSSSKPMPSIPEGAAEIKTSNNADFDLEATLNAIFFNFEQGWDRVMDAFNKQRDTESTNQVKLLRLVSETLGDNVDKALGRIVQDHFEAAITPMLNDKIQEVLEKSVAIHLKNILNGIVQTSVAKEIQSALSGALTKALSSPQFSNQMSLMMSKLELAREVTQQSTNQTLRNVLNNVGDIQKQRSAEADRMDALLKQRERDTEAINTMVEQRQADSEKIDKLETVVRQLGELVSSIASAEEKSRQSNLEREDKLTAIIESLQSQASIKAATPSKDSPQVSSSRPSPDAGGLVQQHQQEDQQDFDREKAGEIIKLIEQALDEARRLFAANNIPEALTKIQFALHSWLSCGDDEMTQVIFDYCLSKENPMFIWDLQDPIYIFITMRAVASNLKTPGLRDRIEWLNNCIRAAMQFNYGNMNPSLTENFPEVVLYVRNCIVDFYKKSDDLTEEAARILMNVAELCNELIHKIQN